jgi:hypothetical protein
MQKAKARRAVGFRPRWIRSRLELHVVESSGFKKASDSSVPPVRTDLNLPFDGKPRIVA